MFEYPIEKYRFYTATKITGEPYRVVAVSTYEGKTVRGVAKCDPRDNFDMELGKQLAAARCNQKIARKRVNRASKQYNKAENAVEKANKHMTAMTEYLHDACAALSTANEIVKDLLKKI